MKTLQNIRCPACRKLLGRQTGCENGMLELRCTRCKAIVMLHDRKVTLQREELTTNLQ